MHGMGSRPRLCLPGGWGVLGKRKKRLGLYSRAAFWPLRTVLRWEIANSSESLGSLLLTCFLFVNSVHGGRDTIGI